MRLTVFAATLAFLLWGTPAFAGTAPDYDSDGVGDQIDNCSEAVNTEQDDTDVDDCGNICDADYDDSGIVDFRTSVNSWTPSAPRTRKNATSSRLAAVPWVSRTSANSWRCSAAPPGLLERRSERRPARKVKQSGTGIL